MTVQALLPLGLAFIMFSLGLVLRISDFRRALARPGVLATGLLAQVVLLPLTALLIALVLGLDPGSSAGLMILAACPGGVTAGMVTYLARGETALSIALSAITSLAAFVSVPLVVGSGLSWFLGDATPVAIPTGQLAGGLFVVTLLPVALGLWLAQTGWLAAGLRRLIQRLATVVFVLIVLFTFVDQWDAMTLNFRAVGPACLLLNVITMGTGAGLGAMMRLPAGQRVALAMECGMQNSALGITLAVSLLGRPELAVPSAIYAMLMNITAFAVIAWRRRQPPPA